MKKIENWKKLTETKIEVWLQVKGGEWSVSNLAKNKSSESRGWRTGDLAPSGPLPLSVILGKYWLVSEVSSPWVSVWFLFVVQLLSHVQLSNPMDSSTPSSPVLHYLPEFVQIHVHWVSDAISSSAALFSFYPHRFPTAGSFPVNQLFASGRQSIGVSASASVLPITIQGWFPLGLTVLISLSKGLSRVFSSTTNKKHQFFGMKPIWDKNAIEVLSTVQINSNSSQEFSTWKT